MKLEKLTVDNSLLKLTLLKPPRQKFFRIFATPPEEGNSRGIYLGHCEQTEGLRT